MEEENKKTEEFNLEPEKFEEIEKNVKKKEPSLKIKKLILGFGFVTTMVAAARGLESCSLEPKESTAIETTMESEENINTLSAIGPIISYEIEAVVNEVTDTGNTLPRYYVRTTYEVKPTTNPVTGEDEYVVPNGFALSQITDQDGNLKYVAYNISIMSPEVYNQILGETPSPDARLGQIVGFKILAKQTQIDENMDPVLYRYVELTYEVKPTIDPTTGETIYVAPAGYTITQNDNQQWVATIVKREKVESKNNDIQEYSEVGDDSIERQR